MGSFVAACAGAVLLLAWSHSRKISSLARWPIIVFTAVHTVVLLIGAYSTFGTYNAYDQVPPLISLFGFIHFENNIFVLATAVFILALVKERSEAASKMAAHIDPLTGIANRGAFMESAPTPNP